MRTPNRLRAEAGSLLGTGLDETFEPDWDKIALALPFDADNGALAATSGAALAKPVALALNGDSSFATWQKKIGASALGLFGNGDHVAVTDPTDDIAFGTSDFTVEALFFSYRGDPYTFCSRWTNGDLARSSWSFGCGRDGQGQDRLEFRWSDGAAEHLVAVPWTPVVNAWFEIAAVRAGNVLKFFLDGTQLGTDQPFAVTTMNGPRSLPLHIAKPRDTAGQGAVDGLFDGLHIARRAVYTTNYAPRTTAFANGTNSVLCLNPEGADGQTTGLADDATGRSAAAPIQGVSKRLFADHTPAVPKTVTRFNGAAISAAKTLHSPYALTLDGTGWLEVADHPDLNFAGEFTIELVFAPAEFTAPMYLIGKGALGDAAKTEYQIWWNNADDTWRASFRTDAGTYTVTGAGGAVPKVPGAWYWVTLCRRGTALELYVNGVKIGTTPGVSGRYTAAAGPLRVGHNSINSFYPTKGTIAALRVTNGVALYVAHHAVPDGPLGNVPGTVLLLTFENGSKNMMPHSETLTDPGWATNFLTLAPDAYVTRDGVALTKLIESPELAAHTLTRDVSLVAGERHTASLLTRAGERAALRLTIGPLVVVYSLGAEPAATITAAALGATAGLEEGEPGVWRVWAAFDAAAATYPVELALLDAEGAAAYTGDGVSGLLAGGVQVERGAAPSFYERTLNLDVVDHAGGRGARVAEARGTVALSAGGGRYYDRALYTQGTANDYVALPAHPAWALAGDFAIRFWMNKSASSSGYLWFTNTGSGNTGLRLDANGVLSIVKDGAVLGATPTNSVLTNAQQFVEMRRVGQTLTLAVQGTVRLTLSGNTTVFANSFVEMRIGMISWCSLTDFEIIAGTTLTPKNPPLRGLLTRRRRYPSGVFGA
ncbi:hypothetical protein [Azospirillum argentinense]|uniref:LamG domain-containing protein n=1 Tax=Azospirillum argentinense TaxID=2970906 RepID=UPI0032DE4D89